MRLLHQYNTQVKQKSSKNPSIKQSDIYCIRLRAVVGIISSAVMQTGILVYSSPMQSLCALVIHQRRRQSPYREK